MAFKYTHNYNLLKKIFLLSYIIYTIEIKKYIISVKLNLIFSFILFSQNFIYFLLVIKRICFMVIFLLFLNLKHDLFLN